MDERTANATRVKASGWVTDEYAAMVLGLMVLLCLAIVWLTGSPA